MDMTQITQWMERLGPIGILLALVALALGVVVILGAPEDEAVAVARHGHHGSDSGNDSLPVAVLHRRTAGRHLGLIVLNNAEVKSAFR